ncbi:MAG: hypothetical protein RIT40_1293, partial [Planctomycetota bacterium]
HIASLVRRHGCHRRRCSGCRLEGCVNVRSARLRHARSYGSCVLVQHSEIRIGLHGTGGEPKGVGGAKHDPISLARNCPAHGILNRDAHRHRPSTRSCGQHWQSHHSPALGALAGRAPCGVRAPALAPWPQRCPNCFTCVAQPGFHCRLEACASTRTVDRRADRHGHLRRWCGGCAHAGFLEARLAHCGLAGRCRGACACGLASQDACDSAVSCPTTLSATYRRGVSRGVIH